MSTSFYALALLSGRSWPTVNGKATVTYTVEGTEQVNQFGVTTPVVNQTFLASVHQAAQVWERYVNIDFVYSPHPDTDPGNPFLTDNANVTFRYEYDPEIFQNTFVDSVINVNPEQGAGFTITDATVTYNPLFYNVEAFQPNIPNSYNFTSLLESFGIASGMAWGRGIQDETFLESLQEYYDEYAIYLADMANNEEPERPEEPVSDIPSFFIDSDGNNATFLYEVANYDNTISLQQNFIGANTAVAGYPDTPMFYDIEAMQQLYGVNLAYNAGDTTYVFDGSQRAELLWDGSGNDTFNSQGFAGNVVLDLRETSSSVTQVGSGRYWNAEGSNMDNAFSGVGDDTLYGNQLDNVLSSGAGADVVIAGEGNDVITSDAGNDRVETGAGNDTVTAGEGDDTLFGEAGDDRLSAGMGNDSILGEAGNDFANGNQGVDTVIGGEGDDHLLGGKDSDIVSGGVGNDRVNGNIGNDAVDGGEGDDLVFGGQNDDALAGNDGNDTLSGDLGNDTLLGGAGNDVFVYNANGGNDEISDFIIGDDKIQFSSQVFATADEAIGRLFISGATSVFNIDGDTLTVTGAIGLTASDIIIA